MPKNIPTIKLSRLLNDLANEIELLNVGIDTDISFSGLRYNRCKKQGDITQVQFVEQVYLDAGGKVVVETPEE
jgi:hypothetical protein